MPHFEDFYANKLRGSLGVADAEAVLDLRGASREQAAASIQDMLERSRFAQAKSGRRPPRAPPEGGGETLFQPVGKALLEAKKRGWIERLQTLPAHDGLGFYVVLAGKPEEGSLNSVLSRELGPSLEVTRVRPAPEAPQEARQQQDAAPDRDEAHGGGRETPSSVTGTAGSKSR